MKSCQLSRSCFQGAYRSIVKMFSGTDVKLTGWQFPAASILRQGYLTYFRHQVFHWFSSQITCSHVVFFLLPLFLSICKILKTFEAILNCFPHQLFWQWNLKLLLLRICLMSMLQVCHFIFISLKIKDSALYGHFPPMFLFLLP